MFKRIIIAAMLASSAPALAQTPVTPDAAAPHMVKLVCPERGSSDGEIGTAVRIDATHAITDYHVVKEGMCREGSRSGFQVRIVYSIPELDFAIIETKDTGGSAWAWGFDCSPPISNATYYMGGYADGRERWVQATSSHVYHNDKVAQDRDLITHGGQLSIGMSGGPAYTDNRKVAGLNGAYFGTTGSMVRLLADTPICDPKSEWYRGDHVEIATK